MLPKNSRTIEGKRHVYAAPVKLFKAQNSKHASHVSTKFARSSIKALEEIATILGPEEVAFHSMDDKAKVPIGITAAEKQTLLLIHMEYQVTLLDHDFVVGSRHKLIPSVAGDMKVVKSKHLIMTVLPILVQRISQSEAQSTPGLLLFITFKT